MSTENTSNSITQRISSLFVGELPPSQTLDHPSIEKKPEEAVKKEEKSSGWFGMFKRNTEPLPQPLDHPSIPQKTVEGVIEVKASGEPGIYVVMTENDPKPLDHPSVPKDSKQVDVKQEKVEKTKSSGFFSFFSSSEPLAQPLDHPSVPKETGAHIQPTSSTGSFMSLFRRGGTPKLEAKEPKKLDKTDEKPSVIPLYPTKEVVWNGGDEIELQWAKTAGWLGAAPETSAEKKEGEEEKQDSTESPLDMPVEMAPVPAPVLKPILLTIQLCRDVPYWHGGAVEATILSRGSFFEQPGMFKWKVPEETRSSKKYFIKFVGVHPAEEEESGVKVLTSATSTGKEEEEVFSIQSERFEIVGVQVDSESIQEDVVPPASTPSESTESSEESDSESENSEADMTELVTIPGFKTVQKQAAKKSVEEEKEVESVEEEKVKIVEKENEAERGEQEKEVENVEEKMDESLEEEKVVAEVKSIPMMVQCSQLELPPLPIPEQDVYEVSEWKE